MRHDRLVGRLADRTADLRQVPPTGVGELEDAILTAITEIEERTAKLPDVDKQWAEAQKEFATAQAEGKERLERMLADQKDAQAKLAETEVGFRLLSRSTALGDVALKSEGLRAKLLEPAERTHDHL